MVQNPTPAPGARPELQFGAVTGQHQLTWSDLLEQWQTAEALGFDSIWLFDHFTPLYGDPDGPCLEASTLLAALAREIPRVRIGVLVYGNTHRHPVMLAKELATLDHLSDGRLIAGIGTGWHVGEHHSYGWHFPSPGDRVAMLDESLQILHSLFTERRTTFNGAFYQLDDAPFGPKPLQQPLPILIGGRRPKMLRVIARHADWWDTSGTPEEIAARGADLDRICQELGRDPTTIGRSISLGADTFDSAEHFESTVRAYHAVGVRQLLFDFPLGAEGTARARRIAEEILPRLREELTAA